MKRNEMDTMRSTKCSLAVAAAVTAALSMSGCELAVQFDRNKIDGGEQPDGTLSDASPTVDGTTPDSFADDAPLDTAGDGGSALDAAAEAGGDALVETGFPDARAEGSSDAQTDSRGDAPEDVVADVPADVLADAVADVGVDALADAPAEALAEAGDDGTVDGLADGGNDGSADAIDDGANLNDGPSGDGG